ncbi:RNA polymerase sigma-54 factor [Rhodobacteraceae bacterium RKSG542]|uniref:RNA polymerase factor sigma-54 n=1 Tax=Pseudovibrio flavus TaxID=2529854 RepID=UPI0012BBFDD2|nr:RNA polymerase factor sigma-54 [Pseudovibrio flavus]MTI17777.1 RNA polymerase sigma-54 factor [Pseudovibrio flavus]
MALSPKLEIRQSQQLVMTPQLMQAIKLLQLSSLDLVSYVDQEIESNPFLEKLDGDDNGLPVDGDQQSNEPATAREEAQDANWMESQLETDPSAISTRMDADLSNVFPDDNGEQRVVDPTQSKADNWQTPSMGNTAPSGDYNLEAFVASQVSLADHLWEQVTLAITEPSERLVARFLIDCLDEAGYLRIDEDEISEQLGISREKLEDVIASLQGLEPAGIFARNLQECLIIQLKDKNRFDPAMAALIDNIELLAKRDFVQLKRLCGVDDEDLRDMVGEIKMLDPKPGAAFGSEIVQPVVPDAIVKPTSNGGWSVELNPETLPRVLVNQTYYSEISKDSRSEGDLDYFTDCLQTANWLAKSLDQRAKTILKVSSEIVRQQDRFLTYGVQHLKPLNLKSIADAIGMHESTVSRVTSNKYISTTRGIFELKYFFSSAIAATEGGDAHSAEAVRYKIKQLIDAETAKSVLSDDTIVKILKADGVDIARRTVAKYRESMRIPSSVQRRRDKQQMA